MKTLHPIRRESAWRSVAAAIVLLGVVAGPALTREAAAANPFRPDRPWIYQTDALVGAPPFDDFYQLLPESGTATVRMFITVKGPGEEPNLGDPTGTPCAVGAAGRNSDHVCAFNVNLRIGGTRTAELLSYTPNPALAGSGGLASIPSGSFPTGQTTLSLSFVNSVNPLAPEAQPTGPDPGTGESVVELGSLVVSTFGPGATVEVLNGEAVRSASLFAIDLTDPGQSLASLSGDPMQAHALAVSISGELPASESYVLGGPAASFQPSNLWAWEGGVRLSGYRGAIQDPVRFGPGGFSAPAIAPAYLATIDDTTLTGVDGFISPWWADVNTPPEVATAAVNFFLAGGDLILLQDDAEHDLIGELLGIPTSVSTGSVSNGGAPLFDGPFGRASNVVQVASVGQLGAADVAGHGGTVGSTNAEGQITAAFWNAGEYEPGSGRLLIVADVDMWSNDGATYAPLNGNGRFALNGTAFVVAPEPVVAFVLTSESVLQAGVPALVVLAGLCLLRGRRG